MTDPIRVLVVDDEEPIRKTLSKGFRQPAFNVVCAASPEEYVDLELLRKPNELLNEPCFDVCIIDLGFDKADPELKGFKMLLALASRGITIVYSGHPTVANAVRSMQLGADHFVSKADMTPHELVKHIESLLADRQAQEDRRRRIDEYVRQRNGSLSRQYPGRVLAIVVDGLEPQVAVNGATRLDALLRYAKLRKDHPDWPVDPYLYIVPSITNAQGVDDE